MERTPIRLTILVAAVAIALAVAGSALAATVLKNGSLEQDADSNGVPDCWEQAGYGTNSFSFTRTGDAFMGSFAERIDMTQRTDGDRKLIVLRDASCAPPVTVGHSYRVSAWYKSNVQPLMVAYFLDANFNSLRVDVSDPFASSSDWRQAVYTTGPAPTGAKYVSFGLAIAAVGNLTVDGHGFSDAASPPPAPSVSLTSPSSGSTVSGNVPLAATASGGAGVDHVDFLVNGTRVASDKTSPYSATWNSTSVPDGAATIAARAVDADGTPASSSVPVTVKNSTATTYPKNASLEQDADSNGVPDCWQGLSAGTNTATYTRTTDAYAGSYAERLVISQYTSGNRKLIVSLNTSCMPPVSPGHTYRLSAYYKSSVQPYLTVFWRDASGQAISSATSSRFPVSSTWRQAAWTSPLAPTGARYLSFGLWISAAGSITVDQHGFADNTKQLLPDIVQQPPLDEEVDLAGASWRLGFNSASENHGDGPLKLEGHRPDTSSTMVVDQRVAYAGTSSTQLYPGIGTMQYYAPHNHWHYTPYMKYELRRPSDYALIAPDQKQGFCLGDRYTLGSGGSRDYPPNPPGPYTGEDCEAYNTDALKVTEGISVGYGDEYVPQLEGQYIDVTGVSPGDYTLVHRLNVDRSLREKSYSNDAASALISLWPNGYGKNPRIQVLKTCPTSDHCTASASAASRGAAPPQLHATRVQRAGPEPTLQGGLPLPEEDPPLLVPRAARFYAAKAVRRALHARAHRMHCARRSARVFACRARTRRGRATVRIALPRRNDQHWWSYRVRLAHRVRAARVRLRAR